ncbi:MAG: energy-coupling factor ABC transporter ATP-binding protein, partial [Chloroflexota bacterium]|nr:energy-coupling factor ABC transporter ATP-binding protein [Chloroflexota bacterium]
GSKRPVLDAVDLTIEPGSVLGIVGANDAGKSTLCLVAAGLAPATIGGQLGGEVLIDGTTSAAARPYDLAQRCGVLFQNPTTQLSGTTATVWEEVAFGPRNLGLSLEEIVERVGWALSLLGIDALAGRDPARLSGGQAQLVALASVLAMRPSYLVLDEPTSQLDPHGTQLAGEALARLAASSEVGILLVEHKTDLLEDLAQRVAVLSAGRVVAIGPAADVLQDERLDGWGVDPPSRIRLARAAQQAGVLLPAGAR